MACIILSPPRGRTPETYTPAWPLPKLFRLTKGGKLTEGIFEGETINTPSMLCVEDYIDALNWAKSLGGLKALIARADANAKAIADWVERTPWIDFLAARAGDPLQHQRLSQGRRSGDRGALAPTRRPRSPRRSPALLEKEEVALDIGAYRDAPPGLRIWCGATVETADVEALTALARLRLRDREGEARQGGLTRTGSSPPRMRGSRAAASGHRADARIPGLTRTSAFPSHFRGRHGRHSRTIPMTPRVLISDKLSPAAVAIFKERGVEVDVKPDLDKERLAKIIGDYDGLAIRSATKVTAKLLERAKKLKVVGRAGIGVDNVDIPAATARGVIVMNTPFGNSITTAEHAIALMFALARQIPSADVSTQAGKWEKNRFMGVELTGKTLGIIGCGNIGSIVAARAWD